MNKSCAGSALGVLLVAIALCAGLYFGCSHFEGFKERFSDTSSAQKPPMDLTIVDSDKTTIDEMRALWNYERDYSHRYKRFANSITDLGDGVGIGSKGYVLSGNIWSARFDAAPEERGANHMRADDIGYFYKLVPQCKEDGSIIPLTAVISAIPEKDTDPCFVAICGPVDLSNEFSFNNHWKLFKFVEAPELLNYLKTQESASLEKIESLLPKNEGRVRYIDVDGDLFPTIFYSAN